MTLNITILSRDVVYQAGDYRLSTPVSKLPIPMPSTKAVELIFPEWAGFVTYTGIGRVGTMSTAEFVAEWLEGLETPTFEAVTQRIADEGSRWISRNAPGARQSFVVTAFVDHQAIAAMISNFQRWHGLPLEAVLPTLEVSLVRLKRKPVVLVTGESRAVTREQRKVLAATARLHAADPARVRSAMADAIRSASRSVPNTVSEDSYVQSMDRHGQGRMEAAGRIVASPQAVFNGINVARVLAQIGREAFGEGSWAIRSGTMGTSSGPGPEPRPCGLTIEDRDQVSGYCLEVLPDSAGGRCQAFGVNDGGVVVGGGSLVWAGPRFPLRWSMTGEPTVLGGPDTFQGCAFGVSQTGHIVGEHSAKDLPVRAFVSEDGQGIRYLGGDVPFASSARVISKADAVVGWTSVSARESGQAHQRPIEWRALEKSRIARDLGGRWGAAVDVDGDGLILILAHNGRAAGAAVWVGEELHNVPIPEGEAVAFYPIGFVGNAAVVGMLTLVNGRRIPALRQPTGEWLPLKLPEGAHVTCTSYNLIAGAVVVGTIEHPWLVHDVARESVALPRIAHHSTRPQGISDGGVIVGTASSDNCSHAVIWRPIVARAARSQS